MYHALYIEEILLIIFGYLYPSWPPFRPWRRRRYVFSDLVALSRTCRLFKEPALDMIWAELDSLAPLVCCLPKEFWIVCEPEPDAIPVPVYSLRRTPGNAEWDIILGYARRVRALLGLSGSLGLAADSIEAFSRPPVSGSIFPNLRRVALNEPSVTVAPLVRHFAHSNVTDILLWGREILGTAIDIFRSECPFVTHFDASQWNQDSDAISSLICNWQNLCSLCCGDISLNVHAISHLSRLHNLVNMSLEANSAVVDQIHTSQSLTATLTFPALHKLLLKSTLLTPVWGLIRLFRLPAIRVLSAALLARPTVLDLMSFFVSLQEACAHHMLESLMLRVYYKDGTIILTSPLFYVTFDRIRPLTVFANIKSITLDIPCGVDLNERELLTLASSWPHLEVFDVATDYHWTPSSAISLSGFLALLERCRSLRVLCFMFDTRGYTEIPQGHPWRGLTMPQHAFIHLLNSPIEEASIEALGVFFHVAPYPDFSLTTHWNNPHYKGSVRPRELCDLYYDRWVRARTIARDLWEERGKLRHSLEAQPQHHRREVTDMDAIID